MKLFLAVLFGALAMFFWQAVAHMFTPLGEAGLDYLPKPDAVTEALGSAIGDRQGLYMFPTGGLTAESTNAEKRAAMERIMDEMKTKPSGLLMYKPAGTVFNFDASLMRQFAIDFLVVLFAVLLLSRTVIGTFGGRVGFVTMAGLLAAIATNLAFCNWYGFPAAFTAANAFMEVMGFFLAGLVIAFLWRKRPAASAAWCCITLEA